MWWRSAWRPSCEMPACGERCVRAWPLARCRPTKHPAALQPLPTTTTTNAMMMMMKATVMKKRKNKKRAQGAGGACEK